MKKTKNLKSPSCLVMIFVMLSPLIFWGILYLIGSIMEYRSISKEEKMEMRMVSNAGKIIKQNKNLEICATGHGWNNQKNQIEVVMIDLNSDLGPVTIEQARELIVYSAKTLLDQFNNNEEFRPYLSNYPFNEKNIAIVIFLHEKNHDKLPPSCLNVVSLHYGIIEYEISLERGYKTLHEETYQEALNKVF